MNTETNLSTAKIPGGYLLQNAQHKDYKLLKRGQLWTNLNEIREACSWYVGYRKEYLSKSKINAALEWMRSPSESEDEDRGFKMTKEKSQQWYDHMINLSDEEFLKKVDLCLSICRKVPFMADVLGSRDPSENTNEKPYWLNAES